MSGARKQGKIMSRKVENGLALLAALIVLFGDSAAASLALADDTGAADPTLKNEVPTTN